jgi:hypothetical protein
MAEGRTTGLAGGRRRGPSPPHAMSLGRAGPCMHAWRRPAGDERPGGNGGGRSQRETQHREKGAGDLSPAAAIPSLSRHMECCAAPSVVSDCLV